MRLQVPAVTQLGCNADDSGQSRTQSLRCCAVGRSATAVRTGTDCLNSVRCSYNALLGCFLAARSSSPLKWVTSLATSDRPSLDERNIEMGEGVAGQLAQGRSFRPGAAKTFGHADFIFDPVQNQFYCPAGEPLMQYRRNFTVQRSDNVSGGNRKYRAGNETL
jgi:hypothetical protein